MSPMERIRSARGLGLGAWISDLGGFGVCVQLQHHRRVANWRPLCRSAPCVRPVMPRFSPLRKIPSEAQEEKCLGENRREKKESRLYRFVLIFPPCSCHSASSSSAAGLLLLLSSPLIVIICDSSFFLFFQVQF